MYKGTLITLFLVCSFALFMIKLPSFLHHYDKACHFLFYFVVYLILVFTLKIKTFYQFIITIILLILFSVFIEYAQEFSNSLFRKRIHGKFDIQDIKYNIYGLVSSFGTVYIINFLDKLFLKNCNSI
jgi:hypothetical protein